jgi:hypothetical protein
MSEMTDVYEYFKLKKNYDPNNSLINTFKLSSINKEGNVEPIKKWIFDAIYEN